MSNPMFPRYDTPPGADAAPPTPHRPTRATTAPRPRTAPTTGRPAGVVSGRRAGSTALPLHRTVAIGAPRRRPVGLAVALAWLALALCVAAAVCLVLFVVVGGSRP